MQATQEDAILRDFFRVSSILGRRACAHGFSRQEIVLQHLISREQLIDEGTVDTPLTTSDLARIMGITSQSLGETLSKMEKEGLITRCASELDRRSAYVVLADASHEASKALLKERKAYARDSLACLDAEEKRQFALILKKLNAAM